MRTTFVTFAFVALSVGPLARAAQAQAPKPGAISADDRKEAIQHYQAGMEKMQAESFAEAVEEFQAAIKLDRLLVLAHYQLGEARMALKDYPGAVEALEACVTAHKELMALRSSDRDLGQKRLDEEIEALKDSQRHLAMDSSHSAGPGNQALRLENRLHELEQDRHRGTMPTDVPAEFSLALGSAYLRAGRMDDAEKAYGEAIKVNAKMGEAHNNLAFVYFRTGRAAGAEQELKAAEKAGFPVNPRFKDDVQKAKKEAAAKP
jgi:tetratricopeptide (TPR) repeat protein